MAKRYFYAKVCALFVVEAVEDSGIMSRINIQEMKSLLYSAIIDNIPRLLSLQYHLCRMASEVKYIL